MVQYPHIILASELIVQSFSLQVQASIHWANEISDSSTTLAQAAKVYGEKPGFCYAL